LTEGARPAAEFDRLANLLGALALVVGDRMQDGVGEAASGSVTQATALSALHHFLDRPSIELLRQVLGLTSSGTVRLVDRLEEAGHVARRRGSDARASLITLTPSGRRAAKRVSRARGEVLAAALATLEPSERQALEDLISRVLVGLMRGPGAVRWMCRLCDTTTCGRPVGKCPVANAAVERYGSPAAGPERERYDITVLGPPPSR
jgi:DNA-binding MarR family transcriptional regulator